ncbi:MAG: PilZ domain-containing protein [Desulfobacterales bacterium]
MNFTAKSYTGIHSKGAASEGGGRKGHPDPRKYPRKPCLKSVFFKCGDQQYAGMIKNISRGGVFIETLDKFLRKNRRKKRMQAEGRMVNYHT